MARRIVFSFLLLLALALPAILTRAREDASPSRPTEKPSVEQLIDRLDSDDFATREAATRALCEREDAEPALRRALHSGRAEVRRRAAQVLEEREARARQKRVRRLLDHLKNGEVDRFIERAATAKEGDVDDKVWLAALDLAERVRDKANQAAVQKWARDMAPAARKRAEANYQKYANWPRLPCFGNDRTLWPAKLAAMRGTWANEFPRHVKTIRKRISGLNIVQNAVLVSEGPVQATGEYDHDIIFANGDVTCSPDKVGTIRDCIVICDGSIECASPYFSILIATGRVKFDGMAGHCFIVENAREALGVLRFYDPRQAGIEVEESADGLVVKKLTADKPFARSGLRAGDRVRAIGGAKVSGLPAFRRLLRHQTCTSKEAVFTVERAGQRTAEVTVKLAH